MRSLLWLRLLWCLLALLVLLALLAWLSWLSWLWRSLALSLGLDLLLVSSESSHSQLLDVLLRGHAMLRSFSIQLFALLFSEFLRSHTTPCGLSSELLLHGGNLLGRRLAGRRHVVVM